MTINLPDAYKDGDYSTEYVFYWYPKVLEFEDFTTGRQLVWFEFVELEYVHSYDRYDGMSKKLECYRIISFKDYWRAKFNKNKKNEN